MSKVLVLLRQEKGKFQQGLKYGAIVSRTPGPSYVIGGNMYGHDRWRDAAGIMAFLGALLIIGALL